jgi:hypothetical protein
LTDFPTLGLKFDLTPIVSGEAGLARLKKAYIEAGFSAEEAGRKAEAANIAVGRAIGKSAEAQVIGSQAAQRAADAEVRSLQQRIERYNQLAKVAATGTPGVTAGAAQAAADKQLQIDRALINSRLALQRQQAAQTLAIDVQTLAFRQRMLVQQAAAEAAASKDAVKAFTYTHGLKLKYLADEEKAAAVTSARMRAQAEADNKFLNGLQNRVILGTKTSEGQRALLATQAAERGLEAEAAPLIAKMRSVEESLGHTGGRAIKVRESFVILREGMRGDFSRMVGSASILAGAFGLITASTLPLVIAILAVIAVIAGGIAAMVKMQNEASRLDNALLATSNTVGMTRDQIEALGKSIAQSTGSSVSKAVKVLTELTASGEVSGEALGLVADASLRLSKLTGEAADKIAGQLVKGFDDASKAAVELNNHYHFLTLTQFEQIDALQRAGDKQGAYNALMKDLDDHLKTVTPSVGFFAREWDKVTDAVDGAIRAVGSFGRVKDNQEALDAAKTKLKKFQSSPLSGTYGSQIASLQSEIAGRTIVANADQLAAKRLGDESSKQTSAINTHAYLQKALPELGGSDSRASTEINDFEARIKQGDPNDPLVKDAIANKARYEAAIRKKYDKADYKRSGTDNVQNAISRTRATIAGIEAEIAAIGSAPDDPLAEFTAKIKKAGDEAAAADKFGKRSPFAQQQGDLARLKEEASIRLGLTEAAGKQIQAEKQRQVVQAISAQGDRDAFAALQDYYVGGSADLGRFLAAQDKADDALLAAKLRLNDYTEAAKFGVSSTDDISVAYQRATGATKEQGDALQRTIKAQVAATDATDKQADADARAAEARDRLTASLQAYDAVIHASNVLAQQAKASPLARDAESNIQVLAQKRINELRKQGVTITEAQARLDVENEAVLRQKGDDLSRLKISLQDQLRQTFIDTGKLDFKGLRDGVTKALRKSIYDALIAKPIDIVVNAVVDVVTKGLDALLQRLLTSNPSQAGGAGGGVLGGLVQSGLDKLTGGLKGIFAKLPEGLQGALKFAGQTLLYSQVGSSIAGAFGARQNTGSTIGGFVGGAVGGLAAGALFGAQLGSIAGPIGTVVGAILGTLIGGLFGGKPSNFTAYANLTPSGGVTLGGDKPNPDTTKLAEAAGKAAAAGEQTLVQLGIRLNQTISQIQIGQRDPSHITLSDGTRFDAGTVGDAADAANAALLAVLRDATITDTAEKKFIDSMIAAGKGFDDIVTTLQVYKQAQDLANSVDRSILRFNDPNAASLADLRDEQIKRRQQIIGYAQQGLYTPDQLTVLNEKLKQLEKLEITDAISKFTASLNGAAGSLQDFQDAQKKILDYVSSLNVGALSPLSPEAQLASAGNAFFATLNKAKGGDLASYQNITGASDTYLQSAQSFYGGTQAYSAIFQTVQDALTQLGKGDLSNPATDSNAAIQQAIDALNQAIQDNSAQLVGVSTAIANDNGATSTDIQNLQIATVNGLQDVSLAVANMTEAVVQSQTDAAAQVSGSVGGAVLPAVAFGGGLVNVL